nr:hypothetical protein [Tanacetum cinerariifolium]
MFRSLKQEHKRDTVTFRALWKLVLALKAWTWHVETRMADMSRDGYDNHRLIHDMAARHRALESSEEIEPSTYEVGQSFRSVPEQKGAKRVSVFRQPTLIRWVDPKDGKSYIDIPTYVPLVAPVQIPPSLEWLSGSLLISPSSPVAHHP